MNTISLHVLSLAYLSGSLFSAAAYSKTLSSCIYRTVTCCCQDAVMNSESCCAVLLPGWSNAPSTCRSHAGKRNPIMVKMVPMDDHLLLQWMAPKSFREPRLLDLNVNDYVDTPSDTAGDGVIPSGLVFP